MKSDPFLIKSCLGFIPIRSTYHFRTFPIYFVLLHILYLYRYNAFEMIGTAIVSLYV